MGQTVDSPQDSILIHPQTLPSKRDYLRTILDKFLALLLESAIQVSHSHERKLLKSIGFPPLLQLSYMATYPIINFYVHVFTIKSQEGYSPNKKLLKFTGFLPLLNPS